MKRYDLTVIVDGVAINYSFFDKDKRQNYLNEIYTTGKVQEHTLNDVDIFTTELQR